MTGGRGWQYICRGCQTDGDGDPVDKVHDDIETEATAETLARIHRVKTGHDPEVIPSGGGVASDD